MLAAMSRSSRGAIAAGLAFAIAAVAFLLWHAGSVPDGTARSAIDTPPVATPQAVANEAAAAPAPAVRDELPAAEPARAGAVRGRCVAAEDGRPLGGCVLTLDNVASREAKTGEDGRFALEVPDGFFVLRVQATGRSALAGHWRRGIAKRQVEDLGDVYLQRGFTVRGRACDPDGHAAPQVTIVVFGEDSGVDRLQADTTASGVTAEDGSFTLIPDLPAGTWQASLLGRRQRGDGAFTDPAPELPIEVRLRGDDSAWSAPVTMPQDLREATVDVVVPEAHR